MKKIFLNFLIILLFMVFAQISKAQNTVEGIWFNSEKTGKVQIYKAKDGKYYGKIVWLSVPEENGKPRTDINNPNKELQSKPLVGLVNLKSFVKKSDSKFEDGTIYDPKNGKTYSCIMILKNANTLDVRGYIGVSIIGRTTTFTRAR